jgi:phosphatidylserine/phosphatidylglycerophosphate/cardiolipin synthase-like enzyme
MPVDMPVCLLAPKTENVQPFRRHNLGESPSNTPDDLLKRKVLDFGEIGRHLLPMFPRGNERIAIQSRVLAQKCNRELILVKHVMGKLGVPLDDFANEATSRRTAPNFFVVKRQSSRHSLRSGILATVWSGLDWEGVS